MCIKTPVFLLRGGSDNTGNNPQNSVLDTLNYIPVGLSEVDLAWASGKTENWLISTKNLL